MTDPTVPQSPAPSSEPAKGVCFGLGAYLWWGLVFPFYLRAVNEAEAIELLAMRVLFGLPVIFMLVWLTRNVGELKRVVTTWRSLRQLLITTPLIAANWYAFTYAVVADKLTEASFGYYVNPLLSIALAMIFLGERLRPTQWVAVVIAAGATVMLGIGMGGLPLIAVTVALTFGVYGLLRKQADASAATGLAVEMTVLFLPMLIVQVWLAVQGRAVFGSALWLTGLMVLAGAMTVVPLTLFNAAARRVRLSTIGLMQYIAPTCQLLAALLFGERLSQKEWIAFGVIWFAIAIFSADSVRHHRRERAAKRLGAQAAAAAEAMD